MNTLILGLKFFTFLFIFWGITESVAQNAGMNNRSKLPGTMAMLDSPKTPTDVVVVGKGYSVSIQDEKNPQSLLNETKNNQSSFTLSFSGPINQGAISLPVTYSNSGSNSEDGWNLLGNPYPCPYDWNAFWNEGNSGFSGTYYSNINPTIYSWDATSNSYKSYNAAAHSGTLPNGIIELGQGFLAKATSLSPGITFQEQFKSIATPSEMVKPETTDEMVIRLQSGPADYDDFILKFKPGAGTGDDKYDISKLVNPTVNISSYGNDGIFHTLDSRPVPMNNDTVNLGVSGSEGQFEMIFNELPTLAETVFVLKDNYLHKTLLITKGVKYGFSMKSSDPESQGNSRFIIYVQRHDSLEGSK
ncbi:MAG: hypothetical protein ACHQK8_04075 [Bacteroidia bacterium]